MPLVRVPPEQGTTLEDSTGTDTSVAVCIAVHGALAYFRAANQAARSVLQHTGFDVLMAHGSGPRNVLHNTSRITQIPVSWEPENTHRAQRFLFKFAALAACLRTTTSRYLILLDADATITAPITENRLVQALQGRSLGMVEQTGIQGSEMGHTDFLNHYRDHALQWFENSRDPAPDPNSFHFYNSGVVVGTRDAFEAVVDWVETSTLGLEREHQVGEHMITDQDYFQYWCNRLHPNNCTKLPWYWNHCEHWDASFPRPGALITHFSNFCVGPRRLLPLRMWLTRRGGRPGQLLAARGNPLRFLWPASE
mgnify:CR=1 FL=1|jgi:hypothetical protein